MNATNKPLPMPTSRHQTRPRPETQAGPPTQTQAQPQTQAYTQTQPQPQSQKQKHPQTTIAFIFHVSTLIYRPRSTGSPPSISTYNSNSGSTDSNSDATWFPISVSDSASISERGYTSSNSASSGSGSNSRFGSASDSSSTSNRNKNKNIKINLDPISKSNMKSGQGNFHPNPFHQHSVKLLHPLLPRPSAGETIARLQAVGIPFVIVWEPSPSGSSSASGLRSEDGVGGAGAGVCGEESGYGDEDGFDNEFTSEEEVAATITRVLGLKVPICPMKVVGRWTLLRSVAAQDQGQQQSAKDGKDRKYGEGGKKDEKMEEVTGTLVVGENEERCREMARMLRFQPERVVSSEEVERMWKRMEVTEKKEEKKEGDSAKEKDVKKEEEKTQKAQQKEQDPSPKQDQTQGHLQKPLLSLRNRLSCPFDDMKVVESLCFSSEDKIDEESTDDDGTVSEKQVGVKEEKDEANADGHTESPTLTNPSTPDSFQGQYIPVKHRERTVAYVPVSPTSSTSSKKDFESPVTRITSIIFFSPPSTKTWDRDVRVVSKLCQSRGEEAPKLYTVQKPGELRRGSLASSSSSTSSVTPSPTFSTSPSESSLETLATTTSTIFSKASSTSITESVPSKRQFKLTVSRTTSDWIRDVTNHWRATNPNLSDRSKLPYYLIDPLTCALQVLEIGRQRAQSTIWARANLPVHLRQTLRLETLYVVDSAEQPSRLFHDLNGARGGGGICSKGKHFPCSDPDPDLSFQRYLASLGVDVIPAKRCRRLLMSDVYKVEKRVQQLGYDVRETCDDKPEQVQDCQEQDPTKAREAGEADAGSGKDISQAHQRRTSWFRQLITRGPKPPSKSRNPGVGGQDQTQAERPSTSAFASSNTAHNNQNKHTNSSTTNLTINSTNIPNIPPPTGTSTGGIPRSMTTPNTNTLSDTGKTRYTSSTTAKTAKFYSLSAVDMVSRSRTQKTREINAITAFCHSNNIEMAVKYAVNREYWECVDGGLRPVWPQMVAGGGDGGGRI